MFLFLVGPKGDSGHIRESKTIFVLIKDDSVNNNNKKNFKFLFNGSVNLDGSSEKGIFCSTTRVFSVRI